MVDCYESLHALDLSIERYAYALELIQPSANGKMAIRYLKRPWGGSTGHRHPQIVQWFKTRSGRYLYTRLKTSEVLRKVKGYPAFATTKEEVKLVLREAIGMINHRDAVLAALNNFKRQLASMLVRNQTYVAEKDAQIKEWLPKLLTLRDQTLLKHTKALASADEWMPPDAVANPRKAPRVDVTGRTRGRVHETKRRG